MHQTLAEAKAMTSQSSKAQFQAPTNGTTPSNVGIVMCTALWLSHSNVVVDNLQVLIDEAIHELDLEPFQKSLRRI